MAAAEILATGSTAASSTEILIAAGVVVTIGLKEMSGKATCDVEIEDDGGNFVIIGFLNNQNAAKTITGPGNFRVSRRLGSTCGAFKDEG